MQSVEDQAIFTDDKKRKLLVEEEQFLVTKTKIDNFLAVSNDNIRKNKDVHILMYKENTHS